MSFAKVDVLVYNWESPVEVHARQYHRHRPQQMRKKPLYCMIYKEARMTLSICLYISWKTRRWYFYKRGEYHASEHDITSSLRFILTPRPEPACASSRRISANTAHIFIGFTSRALSICCGYGEYCVAIWFDYDNNINLVQVCLDFDFECDMEIINCRLRAHNWKCHVRDLLRRCVTPWVRPSHEMPIRIVICRSAGSR